jgi:hypothetical protein
MLPLLPGLLLGLLRLLRLLGPLSLQWLQCRVPPNPPVAELLT